MSEEQTNYGTQAQSDEIEKALAQLEQEIEIEVTLPNGNTEKMYYKFENLNYKQIESAKLAMLIWDEKLRNLPTTLPTMQQTFFEQAGSQGMAMILYTKDDKGKPVPFDGNINNHRPYKLLEYATGKQYNDLVLIKNFFLSNWGVTSFDFKGQFLNTAELLLNSQMDKIMEMMEKEIGKKNLSKKQTKKMIADMKTILNHSLTNTSQLDSSEQSVVSLDTSETTSI